MNPNDMATLNRLLDDLCNHIAAELPAETTVSLKIENGAAWVEIENELETEYVFPDGEGLFATKMEEALEYLKAGSAHEADDED